MADIYEIHKFYEANLPEYQKKHVLRVTKAFLQLLGWATRKPYSILKGDKWKEFKHFVCVDWQGQAIRSNPEKSVPEKVPVKKHEFGLCSCGGYFVERQNKQKGNFFLGCSRYPKCKNTKTLQS